MINVKDDVNDWLWDNVFWSPLIQSSVHRMNMGDRKKLVHDNITILGMSLEDFVHKKTESTTMSFHIAFLNNRINSRCTSSHEYRWQKNNNIKSLFTSWEKKSRRTLSMQWWVLNAFLDDLTIS